MISKSLHAFSRPVERIVSALKGIATQVHEDEIEQLEEEKVETEIKEQ